MAKYIRKSGDKAYRRVSVTSTALPRFEDFSVEGQLVNYPDTGVVLEILREDGSTELFYQGPRAMAQYVTLGTEIRMSQDVPTERLWIRRADGVGVPYKVPSDLPKNSGLISFYVPGGAQKMELYGDKYFEKIYELR